MSPLTTLTLSPMACPLPSSGTSARPKSLACISVHSEVPSPCTTTGRPARIRSMAVQPASTGTTVAS